MSTLPSPDYLKGVLADEMLLAKLLGWQNFEAPAVLTPNFWLLGTTRGNHDNPRLASTFLPRWRRYWSCAGELIARCRLRVEAGEDEALVSAGHADVPGIYHAPYAQFPSQDDAIRWAICQAAIASLLAEAANRRPP